MRNITIMALAAELSTKAAELVNLAQRATGEDREPTRAEAQRVAEITDEVKASCDRVENAPQ